MIHFGGRLNLLSDCPRVDHSELPFIAGRALGGGCNLLLV